MSQILNANKFEFVDGSKIGSIKILFKNSFKNKHKVFSWKFKEKDRNNSTLNINQDDLMFTREPSPHKDRTEKGSSSFEKCNASMTIASLKYRLKYKGNPTKKQTNTKNELAAKMDLVIFSSFKYSVYTIS